MKVKARVLEENIKRNILMILILCLIKYLLHYCTQNFFTRENEIDVYIHKKKIVLSLSLSALSKNNIA